MSNAVAVTDPAKKNLKADQRALIATVRNDVTIPMYTGVLQPLDDTLIQRGGGRGLKIYDEIERDTFAFSVLQKRKNELVAREWVVEPVSEAAEDKAVAAFLTDTLKSLAFDRLCRDLLDATLKGYAVSEIVWGRTDSAVVPIAFADHDQRRFVFDEDWKLRLLTRENMRDGVETPDRKMIVHRFGVKGNNPYGLGLGHRLFWPVLFKREGVAFWMTFLDKYASPTPIGQVPVGMAPDEELKILLALEAIAQGHGLTVPIGTEIKFLEATRAASASYEQWCRFWNEEMSVAVLGETLSTVIGSVGSQAAATVHTEAKSQIIDADGDLLSDTLQATLLQWLVDYNFNGRRVPKVFRPRPKNEEALGKAREQIAKAEKAEIDSFNAALNLVDGMEERAAIGVLRTVSALAGRMEDASLKAILALPRPRAPAEPNKPKPGGKQPPEDPEPAGFAATEFAAPEGVFETPHFPMEILDAVSPSLDAPIADWFERARSAIAAANDLDAVAELTLRLAVELPIERLADRLSQALVFTELVGRASVVAEAESDGVTAAEMFADAGVDAGLDFKGAPMAEAVEFLRQKVALPQDRYHTLLREGHDRAFVVAGVTRQDVAADLQAMVIRNYEKGGLPGFRADFDRLLASGKWTGDPELAENAKKRAWRTRTIYMTNLSTAHAAGRLKQQRALKDVLPFWQYRHGATRTPKRGREPHIRLDGLTLPADDAGWKRIYPPNGWLCSCAVRAITAAAAGRSDEAKRQAPLSFEVDAAVDGDWRSMPGDTWERGLVPPEDRGSLDPDKLPHVPKPGLPKLETIAKPMPAITPMPAGAKPEEIVDRFLARFGATGTQASLFRDKAGQLLPVSRSLFEDASGALKVTKRGRADDIDRLAETLIDPDEIWVDWDAPMSAAFPEPRLVRTYLRYDPDAALLTGFTWSDEGWIGVTAHTRQKKRGKGPDHAALEKRRHGALLYRREKE